MNASASCSTSHFLPQTTKRFDSVSFAAFRLRCPGCRNSISFEFRVIPLELVCLCYLFYITLLPQTAKRFVSLLVLNHTSSRKQRNALTCMYASATCFTSHFLPQTAKRFDSVSFAAFRLRCPSCRNSVAFEFRVIRLEHVGFCYLFYITLRSASKETL
ncbi:hypothetical protein D5086_027243 [Populus alba]|uniref:Uncharacterized protein n=1 Tax=Populus alba TaxID=43335 RepID=A0ACC4AUS5_POPAL